VAQEAKVFPDPGFREGEYSLEWTVGKRQFGGEVALAARRLPRIALYGKLRTPKAAHGERAFSVPGPLVEFQRLVGRLRSNLDVVVLDASLEEWFPERYHGHSLWGIVGLDIANVPRDRYERATFQISDSDLWFGAPPLKSVAWPASKSVEKTFSATLNSAGRQVWRDTRNGFTIECGYVSTYSLDPYRYGLTFAPVIDVISRQPLSLPEWRDQWISPLVDLASIATKQPETLSWLTVHHGDGRERRSGTVFTGGIHQAPYTAHYENEWRTEPERKPLFTLAQLPVALTKLIREWRALLTSNDPFVELYRQIVFQPDLPRRARFLYLVQALEARHSYANRAVDAKKQLQFETRRDAVIDAVRGAGVSSQHVRFLREGWSKRRPDSLDRRLAALLNQLPSQIHSALDSNPGLEPIRSQLIRDDRANTLPSQLRVLRNHLSHGDRNYADHDLRQWVVTLETMCRAELLSLLGFKYAEIETALSV
jgi:ApeA-like protein